MSQDKKSEEEEFLNIFLSSPEGKLWKEKYKIREGYQKNESPDFLFRSKDNKTIGLEITQYIEETKNGKVLQKLRRIGNKACCYAKEEYKLNISILIDKFESRLWSLYWKDYIDLHCHPGFCFLFKENDIKPKIEELIDNNIDKIIKWPSLVQETIQIQGEYIKIILSGFPNLNGKYDCFVNNESFPVKDPFKNLQEKIDKKNRKYKSYLKNCHECFLLIFLPDIGKGNYCSFSDDVKQYSFSSEFKETFLCREKNVVKLK
ncbi:MAG: hypothetical protein EOM53_05365 [Alphaproteobacteria bacterium]|nr:hypothetical protein [Alphaproteobacteria bacterium]